VDNRYILLSEAAKLLPGRPHATAVWRWATKGCRGIRLESWRFGRRICTTREAIDKFGKAVAEAAAADRASTPQLSNTNTSRTDAARRRAIERARERLHAAGL